MEIYPNPINIKISGTTVTPLHQIENSDTRNGVPTTFIKKKEEVSNGKIGKYPYYSGNGFRGLLHREIADIVMMKAVEKGISIPTTDFHILTAGGGSNYQSQALAVELKVRELNPIASVFGVSLAVEGKLMVSDMSPVNKLYREKEESDIVRSALVGYTAFIKEDSLKKDGKYRRVMDEDEVAQFLEDNEDVQEARKNARESGGDKVKKLSIQAYNMREVIIEGAELVGYIGSKDNFTDIEKGMLLVGLERMMSRQLGAANNIGYGVMNYQVSTEVDKGTRDIMSAKKNDNNIYNPVVETQFDSEDQKCIDAFNDWVENMTEENVLLSKTLVATK